MSGKKSGLSGKLRKLFAKIQREFSFPKVIAVRCQIKARVRTWEDDMVVGLQELPPLVTDVKSLETHFQVGLNDHHLKPATCHRVTPMEEMETNVHQVTCWTETVKPRVHQVDMDIILTRVHQRSCEIPLPPVIRPAFEVKSLRLHDFSPIKPTRIRAELELAKTFPLRLNVVPMQQISKKLQIRYRTSLFKLLKLKPNQVKFVGVCFKIPPTPLRILDVVEEPSGLVALARVTGDMNIQMGKRVWVLVQLHGKDQYLPITLKEE